MKKYQNLSISILAAILILLFFVNFLPPIDSIAANPFNSDKLQCITKTGTGNNLPANTMLSFNSAANFGSNIFSVNVIMTIDEQLIIADMDELSVYTSQSGKISQKSYDELKDLNFAYNFSTDSTTYPYRAQKHTCVKLEDLIKYYPYTNYIIGIVQSGEEGKRAAVLLSEIIRKNDLSLRCVVRADEDITEQFRNDKNVHVLTEPTEKELNKFLLLNKLYLSNLYFDIDFQFVEIPLSEIDNYSQKALKALKNRNVSVYIDDVNSEEDYNLAVQYDPSGIITSNPELIQKLIATDATDENTDTIKLK